MTACRLTPLTELVFEYSIYLIYHMYEHFLPHVLGFYVFYKLWRAVTFHQIGILKNGFRHWKEQSE